MSSNESKKIAVYHLNFGIVLKASVELNEAGEVIATWVKDGALVTFADQENTERDLKEIGERADQLMVLILSTAMQNTLNKVNEERTLAKVRDLQANLQGSSETGEGQDPSIPSKILKPDGT